MSRVLACPTGVFLSTLFVYQKEMPAIKVIKWISDDFAMMGELIPASEDVVINI